MSMLKKNLKLLAGATVGLTVFAVIAGNPQWTPASTAQPISVPDLRGAPISFADLIEKVSPAVVSVNVIREQEVRAMPNVEMFMERFRGWPDSEEFFFSPPPRDRSDRQPQTREMRSLGSGFFISEDGYIVTNNHVVDKANEIQVVLEDGTTYDATLVGADAQTDLAVLRVESNEPFPYVEFAPEVNLRKGDWVIALGNPFGFGGTATAGIISAFGRDQISDNPYTDFMQIDASINKGNSGGPTFDLNGNVVGVNTVIWSPTGGSVGIGFAIPSDLATHVTEQLIKNKRVSRGWLGVTIQDLTPEMAESQGLKFKEGAIVTELVEDSPALDAGIKRGDIVVSLNGKQVKDATKLTRMVGALIANSKNKFVVVRNGKRKTISVTVGERPDNVSTLSGEDDMRPESAKTDESLGVSLLPLNRSTRRSLNLKSDEPGLMIVEIKNTSPLYEAGLRKGMAILEVNHRIVASVADFREAIDSAKRNGRDNVLLAVRIRGNTTFQTFEIPDNE